MRSRLINAVILMFFFLGVTSAYADSFTPKDSASTKSKKHAKVEKCGAMEKCNDMSKCKDSAGCNDMSKCTDKAMKMGKDTKTEAKGAIKEKAAKVINLKSIDKNKDGKVYQCPMDFDVISDKPGKDPKCGMELTEVTLEQAKKNLTDHGFKVK
jgi:hypothetical protein